MSYLVADSKALPLLGFQGVGRDDVLPIRLRDGVARLAFPKLFLFYFSIGGSNIGR